MTGIKSCSMSVCAFNMEGMCHTLGINVGAHAECNTFTHNPDKGGFWEVKGGIGACMATDCKYNDRLECGAPDISVKGHSRHADCETFKSRE